MTKKPLSDVEQMNVSMQIASLKTKLEIESRRPTQTIDLLTVSSVHDDAKTLLVNDEEITIQLKTLFQFAWENQRFRLQVSGLES